MTVHIFNNGSFEPGNFYINPNSRLRHFLRHKFTKTIGHGAFQGMTRYVLDDFDYFKAKIIARKPRRRMFAGAPKPTIALLSLAWPHFIEPGSGWHKLTAKKRRRAHYWMRQAKRKKYNK